MGVMQKVRKPRTSNPPIKWVTPKEIEDLRVKIEK